MMKAAIYHFTDRSGLRPVIYRKQLCLLESYATSLGLTVSGIYYDKQLNRNTHTEFDRFMQSCVQYDALVTTDLYHVSKNTGKCIQIMQYLHEKGVQIFTLYNGYYQWGDIPLDKSLRVATYIFHVDPTDDLQHKIAVENDIFRLFVAKKTKWTIVDQYIDKCHNHQNNEQIKMSKIIKTRDKYDLLLVHNLNNIHRRTSNFCALRERLSLDILSLQEGYLIYTDTKTDKYQLKIHDFAIKRKKRCIKQITAHFTGYCHGIMYRAFRHLTSDTALCKCIKYIISKSEALNGLRDAIIYFNTCHDPDPSRIDDLIRFKDAILHDHRKTRYEIIYSYEIVK